MPHGFADLLELHKDRVRYYERILLRAMELEPSGAASEESLDRANIELLDAKIALEEVRLRNQHTGPTSICGH